jgi:hypothetical protein
VSEEEEVYQKEEGWKDERREGEMETSDAYPFSHEY